jgi:hypothetical protein
MPLRISPRRRSPFIPNLSGLDLISIPAPGPGAYWPERCPGSVKDKDRLTRAAFGITIYRMYPAPVIRQRRDCGRLQITIRIPSPAGLRLWVVAPLPRRRWISLRSSSGAIYMSRCFVGRAGILSRTGRSERDPDFMDALRQKRYPATVFSTQTRRAHGEMSELRNPPTTRQQRM